MSSTPIIYENLEGAFLKGFPRKRKEKAEGKEVGGEGAGGGGNEGAVECKRRSKSKVKKEKRRARLAVYPKKQMRQLEFAAGFRKVLIVRHSPSSRLSLLADS